jgi:N-acetylglucosaminyl-diphospho-decaprenol L-rhamnosyltransferase
MPKNPAHPRITVVTVCYNSMAVLPAMLASVPAGTPVVLVDNSPNADPELPDLAATRGATLIRNDRNLGFGTACNIGAARAATEFLLFLNPDVTLSGSTLEHLTQALDRFPAASAANPRIAHADGSPFFRRRSLLIPRSEWLPRGWPPETREVPTLSGAALIVRKSAFDAVGGFDPDIFLYHEDDDLSVRLRATGLLLFVREALVTHLGGSSTTRSAETAAFKAFHMGQSRVHVARKHGIALARSRAVASALLQLAVPTAWVSRRRRAKQWALLRGTLGLQRQ